jgi:hypothetical protein
MELGTCYYAICLRNFNSKLVDLGYTERSVEGKSKNLRRLFRSHGIGP